MSHENLTQTNQNTSSNMQKFDNDEINEVVIVGSGPAGYTAGIYTSRALLNPLIITGYSSGGQLMLTSDVENFPGYTNPISGPNLMGDLLSQALKFGARILQQDCISVNFSVRPFELNLKDKIVKSRAVIIATGAESIWLNAKREDEFKGKGISTCATCDGFFFRNKSVIVIGGGDSAMEEANFLTRFASEVTILHRSFQFKASKIMLTRARDNPKIKFLNGYIIDEWNGSNGILTGTTIKNTTTGELSQISCDGAFIAIGHKPCTDFLSGQVKLDANGYIEHSEYTMTSVPGVFSCGDVSDTRYKQAITASGSGCQAAIDAERWLENNRTP